MKDKKRKLVLDQLDHKIRGFYELADVAVPRKGWISAIRNSLKMSLRQLGARMEMSAQSVADLEKREAQGAISINAMHKAAEALDLKLIYCFVPKNGSLKNLIEKRAEELAREIVLRTANTMALEEQAPSYERIQKSIQQKKQEITDEMPRYLWD